MLLVSCVSLQDFRARKVVMFPDYTGREVWQVCINSLVDLWDCTITVSDADAGLVQAHQAHGLGVVVFKWTIQVLESREGVNLNIHLERGAGFLSGGTSKKVEQFIKAVRERLEEREKKKM